MKAVGTTGQSLTILLSSNSWDLVLNSVVLVLCSPGGGTGKESRSPLELKVGWSGND